MARRSSANTSKRLTTDATWRGHRNAGADARDLAGDLSPTNRHRSTASRRGAREHRVGVIEAAMKHRTDEVRM